MNLRRSCSLLMAAMAITLAVGCATAEDDDMVGVRADPTTTSSSASPTSEPAPQAGSSVGPARGEPGPTSTSSTGPTSSTSTTEPPGRGSSTSGDSMPVGTWGGDHAEMRVDDDGMWVEFDCAIGSVRGPLPLSSDGSFEWSGTYVTERGNPKVQGEPDARPATYRGTVSGDTMTLTADVPSFGITEGPYTLRKGARGALAKCQ